jgi:predicted Ser/Thr protein kinase
VSTITHGTLVGGFRIREPLGAGAMGEVYLAETVGSGEYVAVKVVAAGPSHDARFRERFERECALAASLQHPNVVTTIASGEAEGHLYLAMEYVEGADLREILRQEAPLEQDRTLRLVAQVADALDAAHELGLVHRDVKPGNILVTERDGDERALVCDFGLARHVSSVSSLTGDRGFVGTIDYVPPEQVQGNQVDRRSDMYSLGCVLFECLVGAKPFERESELAVVFAHLNDPPPRPTEFRPDLPAAWDEFFATALAKEPSERFGSGRELVEAATAAAAGKRRTSRHVRRRVIAVAAATGIAAAVSAGFALDRGASQGRAEISQTAIAGAPLGREPQYYRKHFGPVAFSMTGFAHFPTMTFQGPEVAVFFPAHKREGIPGPHEHAHIIATWNKTYRTAAGIGPCSTLAAAQSAYGARWKPSPHAIIWKNTGGVQSAYVVGKNLIFAITPNGRKILAVGLYEGGPHASRQNSPQSFANFVTSGQGSQSACG